MKRKNTGILIVIALLFSACPSQPAETEDEPEFEIKAFRLEPMSGEVDLKKTPYVKACFDIYQGNKLYSSNRESVYYTVDGTEPTEASLFMTYPPPEGSPLYIHDYTTKTFNCLAVYTDYRGKKYTKTQTLGFDVKYFYIEGGIPDFLKEEEKKWPYTLKYILKKGKGYSNSGIFTNSLGGGYAINTFIAEEAGVVKTTTHYTSLVVGKVAIKKNGVLVDRKSDSSIDVVKDDAIEIRFDQGSKYTFYGGPDWSFTISLEEE